MDISDHCMVVLKFTEDQHLGQYCSVFMASSFGGA